MANITQQIFLREKSQEKLQLHKDAQSAMEFYRKTVIETTAKYKHIMSLLKNTSRNNLESARLVELQKEYAGFISADYMMTRTSPYWGSTPQPAKTYYQMKLVVDIFGIVDHSSSEKKIYLPV